MHPMKHNVTSSISAQQSILFATLRQVLRPFVRLLLSYGITYPMLLEELKRIFVQVADAEYQLGTKPQTDSRITLLTGVHRRDVHRIRGERQTSLPLKINFGAQLIAQWIGNPEFLDQSGLPKILPRFAVEDGGESFEKLVTSVSKDIRARPVLDEWLRTGIIEIVDQDYVKLNTDAFIPKENLEEKLFFLGMNIHDHLAAAVHNILDNQSSMTERCVYYDDLSKDQIEQLHSLVKVNGMKYLKTVNQKAIALRTPTVTNKNTPYRMNTGVYFYFEPMPAEQKNDD